MRKKEREVNDKETLESIIRNSEVCRIALFDEDTPYIVAMNFGYIMGNPSILYFHCATEGKKIDLIKLNNNVFFQMDTDHRIINSSKACGFSMKYKSIVGKGKVFIIEEESEKIKGLNVIMKQYTGRDDFSFDPKTLQNTGILRLEISELTGKMHV